MSKEVFNVDGNVYDYAQVVEAIKESESFRLNFVDMVLTILLDAHDIHKIEKLNLVPNLGQLVHFREHFIESVQSFYMWENYSEDDFNLMCSWQKLVGELLLGVDKGVRYEGPYEETKECTCNKHIEGQA